MSWFGTPIVSTPNPTATRTGWGAWPLAAAALVRMRDTRWAVRDPIIGVLPPNGGRALTETGQAAGLSRWREVDPPQPLRAGEREPEARARRVHRHVAHDGAARGDRHYLRARGRRVECHDIVPSRLIVPETPVGADGDAVRLTAVAPGAEEVAHRAGGGIEPAQPAARVVRVPHDPGGVHDQAARAGRWIGERELAHRAVRRIDATHAIRPEQRHPDRAVGGSDQ